MSSTIKLNNGIAMPAVGLGTWQSPEGEVAKAVHHALTHGYNLVDAAWCYRNEKEVGRGIKESGRDRKDIFVTSKVWSTFHTRLEAGLQQSLDDLGLDYLDLYLIHWPVALNPNGTSEIMPLRPDGSRDILESQLIEDTWKGMEKLLATGKVKAIGVCNTSPSWMDRILATAEIVPAVNQIELHPYLPQIDVVEYCKSKGIVAQAYSPLGSTSSPLLSDKNLVDLAAKYKCSVSQLCISYQVARGVSVVPKSVTPRRIEENIATIGIDPEDIQRIERIHQEAGKTKRFVAPAWGVDFGFNDWTT